MDKMRFAHCLASRAGVPLVGAALFNALVPCDPEKDILPSFLYRSCAMSKNAIEVHKMRRFFCRLQRNG